MRNQDVVDLLNEIGDLLEMKGEEPFKVRAYREAARRVEGLHEDVNTLVAEDRLTEVRGIGPSIAQKVSEFVSTGKSSYRDELAAQLPKGISEVLQIPGVGAKKAQLFSKELGISTVDELEEAAKTHRLSQLPKIQKKTEQNILEGIRRLKQRTGRMLLGTALPAAEEVAEQLRPHKSIERIELGGSIRRMKETIGDIDMLVASSSPKEAIEAFAALPSVRSVLAKGTTKASVVASQDLQMDLRVVSPEQWGAALQYFTGSKDHNIQLRSVAESKGLKVNEYGVFRVETDERVAGREEEEVYGALGMKWMPPELREATGEIEAAIEGKLPDIIAAEDMRGDLHTHTTWSDAANEIEEMAEEARKRGYDYLGISDHSVSMGFIHGLTIDRIKEQRQIIDDLNKGYKGFRLLQGIEVNIRGDGTLDYPDDVLEQFDVVTASIHTGLSQKRQRITERMLAAVRNPHVDIIGHPSGRLINKREPSDFDADAVFRAAAETGTAMEINSQPDRLDLRDSDARRAMEMGVYFAINSDAHSVDQLDLLRYGVATARRGWVEKDRVLNALPANELLKLLGKR